MAQINSITDFAEWRRLWDNSKQESAPSILIFKLSPICPTSHHAESIFNRYVASLPENPALQICSVDVIAARSIAQCIAGDTGIRHESPQAILIKPGQKIAWHANHGDINLAALEKNVGT